jgi:hypothetical protein
MVFRKIYKNNNRSSSTNNNNTSSSSTRIKGRIISCTHYSDDEGSIDSTINNVDRYEINAMVASSKNYDYDDAVDASPATATAATATATATDEDDEQNNINNNYNNMNNMMMIFGSRMMMDDDNDAGWDTTIHVNENEYKTTSSNSRTTANYSSWLASSCLSCV